MTRKEIKEFGQHIADKVFHKKEQDNTIVAKGWVARDANTQIYFYKEKPIKGDDNWIGEIEWIILLNYSSLHDSFPQVNWSDNEPTPCEIMIKIEK